MPTWVRPHLAGRLLRRNLLLVVLLAALPTSAQVGPLTGSENPPDFNIAAQQSASRPPTAEQLRAQQDFQTRYGAQAFMRWDESAGSPAAMWDFRTATSLGDPAQAALDFVKKNSELFGIADVSTLKLRKARPALRGYLVRFDQTFDSVTVEGGGIGLALNSSKQVIGAFGPYYAVSGVNTTPQLSADEAVLRARTDLGQFAITLPAETEGLVTPAMEKLEAALGPVKTPAPQLKVLPAGSDYYLAWDFYLYSRNPFGVFHYSVDAGTGELLRRENMVRYQVTSNIIQPTADVFPTHPGIDSGLQDNGTIPRDSTGRPVGQLRVNLRNFDASNLTSGATGTLTGTHVHVHNTLGPKLPFAQAALGTWHFAQDLPPLEQTTQEREHWGPNAEPAEHQDEVNIFFQVNYLLEYITDLHIRDDRANNPLGSGDFPDDFPNSNVPLQAIVHLPCPPGVAALGCPPVTAADIVERALGLDNAFSVPVTVRVGDQDVVVNPIAHGHGYLFNSFGVEDIVPYHEGMHSISTPIAGFLGAIEGGALNEGQADLWAATLSGDPSLGEYAASGFRLRQAVKERRIFAAADGDPDKVGWIRNANSGLLYSQLCRWKSGLGTPEGNLCEVHQDGEIYEAAMWDLRELLMLYETGGSFVRPDLITGAPNRAISRGQETWERLFLGSIYVMGASDPDTFVSARDAVILADALLYPSGLQEPGNPRQVGMHRTLIEHVFAARELGINASAPRGGRQTVSTAVSPFTAAQPALRKPGGAKATAFGDAVQVCWKATKGALAYEVRKRLKGQNSGRLFPSDAATHEYFEGDGETDGFGHVEYVPASQTCHVDQGQIVGFLRPLGLSDPKSFQYGVRVLSLNSNNTIGISQTEVVDAAEQQEFQVSTTIYSGVVPVGVAGSNLVNGVDYVDVPFEGEPGVIGVNAALDTNPNLGALPDVDFVLLEDTDGDGDCAAGCNQIASSGNFGPNEFLSVVIVPGRTYVYRVVGFANAGTLFTIKSDQFIAAVAP